MADTEGQTPQNTTKHYLSKDNLQDLLETLFPGQTEFNIRVRVTRIPQVLNARLKLGTDERRPVVLHCTENRAQRE
jgi:hypothetical protein